MESSVPLSGLSTLWRNIPDAHYPQSGGVFPLRGFQPLFWFAFKSIGLKQEASGFTVRTNHNIFFETFSNSIDSF